MNDSIRMHRIVKIRQDLRNEITELSRQLRDRQEKLEVMEEVYQRYGKEHQARVFPQEQTDEKEECEACLGRGTLDYDDGDRMIEGDPCDRCNGTGYKNGDM